jgi:hypothetical protein
VEGQAEVESCKGCGASDGVNTMGIDRTDPYAAATPGDPPVWAEYRRILAAAGAYPDHVGDALSALRRIEHADAVDRIFIRQDRGRALDAFAALGPRVILVRSWVEAAIVLAAAGELAPASLERVRAATALSEGELVARFRSVLERGHVEPDGATRAFAALAHHPAWVACAELLRREAVTYRPPTAPVGLDWVELVRAFEGKR